MKKNLLFLFVLTMLISCKKEVPLTSSEMNFTSEENAIIEVNIPKFEGNAEVVEKINSSIEKFVSSSLNDDDVKSASIKEASEVFNSEFIKFSNQFPEASQPWEAFVDGEITYQSSEIISIAINTYTNTGGAHGNSVISFLNFNPSNGELYKSGELINNMSSLKTIAETHFNKMIQEREDSDELNFQFPETIGFNDDGVIILLNSNGLIVDSPEFTIPYEEVSDHLKVH